MDAAKQGFSTLPCQSCRRALCLLPQKSEKLYGETVQVIPQNEKK